MTTAYIALGSNEGDRMAHLAAALQAIAEIPDTHIERVSHAYETEPAYFEDQPKFANAVAEITTTLEPEQLLEYLLAAEDDLGRVRDMPNGPRVIDLDLLLFGDEEITTEALTVPHPGMFAREFVVVPLLDIAPRVHAPGGKHIDRESATEGPIIGDLGPIPDLGASGNAPAFPGDWVPVATCDANADVASGWDAAISLQREVLRDAKIPYAFDPYEPDATMDPLGMPRTFTILVPAAYADRASRLINEAMAAEPEFPEELEADAE